ncbi:MAG TPA: heme NO-binding domain-containing protein [Mycobacteriales bacterium]|nr:heme NO-binding domain-containing protein [Mycobacteriales bacterium]
MKGIVFNLLEGVVTAQFGEDAWDDMLDATTASGAYTAIGNYPEAEFLALLEVTPDAVGATAQERLRWFGRSAMPALAQRYAVFFAPHPGTRSFLMTLNDIIHPEVRTLYPGADVPVFDVFEGPTGGLSSLTLGYRSPRRLCWLAEGFILGAADHFGQAVTVEQLACMHDGAESCLLACTFAEVDARGVD